MLQDICNCYMYLCSSEVEMKDYEERLLEKCFDVSFEPVHLGNTNAYEPPFAYIKNRQDM